jgi:small basic protein
MMKGSKGQWVGVAYYFSIVYLGFLLGVVKNLAPLCLGGMSRFNCIGKLLRELKVAIAEFVCL